jgi:glycosyltransferase involved in cell wall biosynthesis
MRILIAHNAYQQAGGEDSVVAAESAMLLSHGHPVEVYGPHNDEIASMPRLSLAGQTFWSKRTTEDVADLIAKFKPDVIHVHNTFPLISPSLYWAAAKANIPVVQTLHNFRLLCPQAMFLRESKVCEDCLGHLPWRSVVHGCYRESKAQSAVLAGMITLHRGLGTYRNKITRYIALNEFCRQKFIEGGLPAKRIVVKPNFVDSSALIFPLAFSAADASSQGFLYVGRLSAEKGIETLAAAFKNLTHASLRVAGTGPQAALLDGVTGLEMLGVLSSENVLDEMRQASALVMPSIWYENFPRTLVEAFACGLPVIASHIGALAELVEDGVTGLLFEPGNASDLAEKLQWAQQNAEKMRQMGQNARKRYEADYSAEKNYGQLMAIYSDAIDECSKL